MNTTKETPQLENGYAPIANEILEKLSRINLTAYQYRVLFYIFRKTYGYHKKEDWISISQIVEATGLKQSHVSRTKKELINKKILYTPTGIKIAFQKDWRLWDVDIPNEVYRKNIPIQVKNIPNEDIYIPIQGHTKDNIQKIITKDKRTLPKFSLLTDITEKEMQEVAEKYSVDLDFVKSKVEDVQNYCESTGKKYKNYLATLRNWVKKDAVNKKRGGVAIV